MGNLCSSIFDFEEFENHAYDYLNHEDILFEYFESRHHFKGSKPAFPRKCTPRYRTLKYILRLHSDLGHGVLHDSKAYLDSLLRERNFLRIWWRCRCRERIKGKEKTIVHKIDKEIVEKLEDFIMPEVQKLFMLLNQQSFFGSHEDRNEFLAAFMDFLLQILSLGAPCVDFRAQGIGIRDFDQLIEEYEAYGHTLFRKELTFLFTVLGDVPFQFSHDQLQEERVKNLLSVVEDIAIDVGSLIYYYVFNDEVNTPLFVERRDALLEKVAVLNADIEVHCIKFSELVVIQRPLNSMVVSLFNFDSLLEDLENLINCQLELITDYGIVDQIKALLDELKFSRSLSIEITLKDTAVDEFKKSLRDVAYEAEYLINSCVEGNIPVWYFNLRLPSVISKIKLTRTRFQQINFVDVRCESMKNVLNVEESSQYGIAPPVVADEVLVGFEDNRREILSDLIGRSKSVLVISIVGMPGLGKTVTAKKLYHDGSICAHFDRRGWCVVSENYDKRRVLIEILKTIANFSDDDEIWKHGDETLGLKIHQTLSRRRYLIVIDDIWESSIFDDLRIYLPDNGNGSRILLTSRISNVAPTDSIVHSLPLLSETQSWELLEKKVFLKELCPPELLEIGKAVAENCRGLPLALVVTAGILSMEKKESAWKKVKNQLGMHMLDDSDHYRKILEVSYDNLPNHLKPCFLYLGMFPEDSEIVLSNLMNMWIAEGFIRKTENKNAEDIAQEYLLDLINKSLLVIARRKSDGGIKSCIIHDLLRDMCIRRAHNEKFMKCIKRDDFSFFEKYEHFCVHSMSTTWRNIGQHCRGFVGHFSESTSTSHFTRMPLLRVMVLQSHALRTSKSVYKYEPKWIDVPTHVRYLALMEMPNLTQGQFSKLEFLHIACSGLCIPPLVLKMPKLRHLRIKRGRFRKDCDISETTQLEYLSELLTETDEEVEMVKCAPNLRRLKWSCIGSSCSDLRFLTKLESLTIYLNNGRFIHESNYPVFPPTIKKLHLSGQTCLSWEEMSIVGRLPNLEILKLEHQFFRGEEWITTEGEFMELRFLKLRSLSDALQWNTCSEHFPNLQSLVLEQCMKPLEIPSDFGDHPTLEMIKAVYCSNMIKKSAALIGNEQHENGNEGFKVIITS